MLTWRIYYDDGTTFDATQGEPEDASGFGVICIVQADENVGRSVLSKWDWYYFNDDGRWWGADFFGITDRLLNRLPVRAVSAGRTVPEGVFFETMRRASEDPDFLPRSSDKPRFYECPQGTDLNK